MYLSSWIDAFRNRLGRRRRRTTVGVAPAIEKIEERILLSISSLFIGGELSVISDADDSIRISATAGVVTVESAPAMGGPFTPDPTLRTVLASDVTSIVVEGGPGSNSIDLSLVTAIDFNNAAGVAVSIEGRNGDDTILGTADLDDVISGGDGDDVITVVAGNNTIDSGDGDDIITAGTGNDEITVGDGDDIVAAGAGDDTITGGNGDDIINGEAGNDSMVGNDGNDSLFGGDGDDTLIGKSGFDSLVGEGGNDKVFGGRGNDELFGDGTDQSVVGIGNDTMYGHAGEDTLIGGGGADSLDGGTQDDLVLSTFVTGDDIDPPPPPPGPPPATTPGGGGGSLDPATDSGGGVNSGNLFTTLTNGFGDANLSISLNGVGEFGTASTLGFSAPSPGAIYDPIGPVGPADTMFQSHMYFRDNTAGMSGTRQDLTTLSGGGVTLRELPTEANSSFTAGGLQFDLVQTLTPLLDLSSVQNGSLITQTYNFTNNGSTTIDFELVRYIDGDLFFDGTLIDGGGRFVTADGDEILFETDAGGGGTTATTFLGITGIGGTVPTMNRFEADDYPQLEFDIQAGLPLDDMIDGDFDGDEFVDPGREYDITLAFQNLFTLAPGDSGTYTTHTLFGSGAPSDIGGNIAPTANPDMSTISGGGIAVLDVVSNDIDPDGVLDFATINIVTPPTNGTATPVGDGRIQYVPNAGFVGTDSFEYTVDDNQGGTSNPALVTITVVPSDDVGDTLIGELGNDTIIGNAGGDRLIGGMGNDQMDGGSGNDSAFGGAGMDSILGSSGDDTLNGQGNNDSIEGGAGNDEVNGGMADDVLFGDDSLGFTTGNDTIIGGMGNDTADGGGGDDVLFGGGGDDIMTGGADDDRLLGQAGNDILNGGLGNDEFIWRGDGDGNDIVDGDDGSDIVDVRGDGDVNVFDVSQDITLSPSGSSVVGGDLQVTENVDTLTIKNTIVQVTIDGRGDDDVITLNDVDRVNAVQLLLNGGSGNDVINARGARLGTVRVLIDGGDDNDTLTASRDGNTLLGGDGDDLLTGGIGNDTLRGGDGDDSLVGRDGDDSLLGENGIDTLVGGTGDDVLSGGADNDRLMGDDGADTLDGNSGNDNLQGNNGADSLMGNFGNDTLSGGSGADTLDGGRNDDTIFGRGGADKIRGDHGDDSIDGGLGDDTINGGDGNDTIFGDEGNDALAGEDGNDKLVGGNGEDTLVGDDGDDTLLGGRNSDILIGGDGNDLVDGQGYNDILNPGEGDDTVPASEQDQIDNMFTLTQTILDDLNAF